jgi:hypothetical protein
VRHLLTHTAGVPQIPRSLRALATAFSSGSPLTEGGQSYDLGPPLPSLAEYYGGALRLVTEPGMADTDLLRSERVKSRLATGYRLGPHGAKAVTDRQWVSAPAGATTDLHRSR